MEAATTRVLHCVANTIIHTEEEVVYIKRLLRIQIEGIYNSAPILFYYVKQNIRLLAANSD